MKIAKTNWRVTGINLISSDAIYQKLVNCINTDNLEETHLQKITGHRLPILVNKKEKHIQFCNF